MAYGSVKVDSIISSTQTVAVDDLLKANAIGVSVQGYDAQLADVASLTPADNAVIIGNGTNFVAESGGTARTSLGLGIGVDVQGYDADTAKTDVVQSFSVAQRGTISASGTVSGTVTLDFATANNFSMTLSAGAVTLANPSNLTAGQSGAITITQDASTARTLSYGGYFKFEAGTPTITTTLGAISTLFYYVDSSTRITAKLITDPTGA